MTLREKLEYGCGSTADSMYYAFVGSFLMFFLTTVAGIAPAVAGAIIAIGSVWNALFNPILGFLSDRVRTSHGRRRPLMMAASFPLALFTVLLFSNLPLPSGVKTVYYGLMLILFWSSFSSFLVPYLALGVSYTTDYQERTTLRLYASLFNMLGSIVCMVMPNMLVDYLTGRGMSTSLAWTVVGGCISFLSTLTIWITVYASRTKDLPCQKTDIPQPPISLRAILREYASLIALPPLRWMIVASVMSLITYTMIMSDLIYLLTFNLGYNRTEVSLFLMLRAVYGLLMIPLVGIIARKIDKRQTLILFFAIALLGMLLVATGGLQNLMGTFFYVFLAAICTCVYWQLIPSMYYDICDYDQLQNQKDRQGTILSFQGLVEALSIGVGNLLLGFVLGQRGFDGNSPVQTPLAQDWILRAGTLLPSLFLLVAGFAIWRYPINRKSHAAIQAALAERSSKEPFDI